MSLAPHREYPQTNFQETLYRGQEDRVEELNTRMSARFVADRPLEPNFSPRPVPTKYAHFPLGGRWRAPTAVPIQTMANYDVAANFNPGSKGPTSGYFNNIDKENDLLFQSQIPTKQDVGVYVPASQSTLYNNSIVSRPVEQPYPLLFKREQSWQDTTGAFVDEFPQVGSQPLNNATRYQLRSID
jgi:hypothetical protein